MLAILAETGIGFLKTTPLPFSLIMTSLDTFITDFDKALRVVTGHSIASRDTPTSAHLDSPLTLAEKKHSAGLMRVNHVGEVCAQALYAAQGRFTRTPALKKQLAEAEREEEDHLAWTAERLRALNARPSVLNPVWYAGSYLLGTVVAHLGDARSLGFVVETERQVEAHLASHLTTLPEHDHASKAIVEQMRVDEIAHGAMARSLGATEVPVLAQKIMRGMAKLMTTTAYRI